MSDDPMTIESEEKARLSLRDFDGQTLLVEEMHPFDGKFGETLALRGHVIDSGVEFNPLYINPPGLVKQLQNLVRDIPFRVQFRKGEHPTDPTKEMWKVALLTFPKEKK